ncbi:phospholipase D-like domain-containing protein [Acuticoccus mangrovi]|uniref:Phospholipase D n=1 Tax=Acuticoccus mangrovi TaxID=2796142 RepID=A0A934IFB0_9HYPH|nr:phospholipase D-like domain-containing protein [Acuticoccus mangrovi]MBJ3775458.1 hypothetical protein [Acuticoccus mangrovi]
MTPATPGSDPEATDHTIIPLILASAAYPRMERVALSAERSLLLCFRIFQPSTRLRSEVARGLGLETWADLLGYVARRGVAVRVFVADFDPKFAGALHAGTVRTVEELAPIVADTDGRLAVAPARHPGELGVALRVAFWPLVRPKLRKHAGERVRYWPPARLWPATHHMKMIVADAREGVIGGLDVDERRYDDPLHDRPAERTWHDVSLYVKGPVVAEADRFMRWLWQEEAGRRARAGRTRGEDAIAVPTLPPAGDPPTPRFAAPEPYEGALPRNVAFHVTQSTRSRWPVARGPRTVSRTIYERMLSLIGEARWFLYLENQFLRDVGIAAAIEHRMRRVPELQLIVVVPAAPDVVAFEHDRGDGARHGEWLQLRRLGGLQDEFSPRVGIFTLAGAKLPESDEADHSRAAMGSRGIVYVHSKVTIVDDRLAMVASANLNGRSLRMDTETGISWEGAEHVGRFRGALWRHHLGDHHAADGRDVLTPWRCAAAANASSAPGPSGPGRFVMWWNRRDTADFARCRPYMPGWYV